eukprot:scaffold136597_cov31-Tisochrysis_lutea.AAC.6
MGASSTARLFPPVAMPRPKDWPLATLEFVTPPLIKCAVRLDRSHSLRADDSKSPRSSKGSILRLSAAGALVGGSQMTKARACHAATNCDSPAAAATYALCEASSGGGAPLVL